MSNVTSPSEVAREIDGRMVLRDLVKDYPLRYYPKFDSSPKFEISSKRLQGDGFLKKKDLCEIVEWKSHRSLDKIDKNDGAAVERFTRVAFTLARDLTIPPSVPISVLTILHGVRVAVASAVLTVWDPSRFGVIDVNAWSAVFDLTEQHSQTFAPREYDHYIAILQKLEELTGLTPREIDMALWVWWDNKKKATP